MVAYSSTKLYCCRFKKRNDPIAIFNRFYSRMVCLDLRYGFFVEQHGRVPEVRFLECSIVLAASCNCRCADSRFTCNNQLVTSHPPFQFRGRSCFDRCFRWRMDLVRSQGTIRGPIQRGRSIRRQDSCHDVDNAALPRAAFGTGCSSAQKVQIHATKCGSSLVSPVAIDGVACLLHDSDLSVGMVGSLGVD